MNDMPVSPDQQAAAGSILEHMHHNMLLRDLPDAEKNLLSPHFSVEQIAAPTTLYHRGDQIHTVYFPIQGLVSLLSPTGDSVGEVALIGCEGLIGVPALLLPDAAMTWDALVQVPVQALAIKVADIHALMPQAPTFRVHCYLAIEALMFQVGQTAACNVRHALAARLVRWLLMAADRIDDETVPLTHEFLANMLGVRRAGVTVTLNELQGQGLIKATRGRITLVDRPALEAASCPCYRFVRDEGRKVRARTKLKAEGV